MIDVQHQLNSVRRSVGRKMFEAREARVVSVSQTYDTDAADLWDACTSLERIPRWFLPITGDLRVGGQRLLDLDRIDVLAAGDDHLVVAAHHEQQSVAVDAADVAGDHVVSGERLSVAGGVAVESGVALHDDPSDLVGAEHVVVVVELLEEAAAAADEEDAAVPPPPTP